MTGVDLTKLPAGQLSWTSLIEYAAQSDDRVERYFLEIKSSVDLTSNTGRAKVAKFILGAANRDPERAAARLGGYAVMLLGVGSGEALGIEPFEAMDLARYVTKVIGADGPRWDFERVPVGDGRDVIAVVVEPPTGDVWTCRADADGLADGGIYVRADGETRRATGDEIRLMLHRMKSTTPDVHLEVAVNGAVHGIVIDPSLLSSAVAEEAERLRALALPAQHSYATRVSGFGTGDDTRNKSEYLEELDRWEEAASADPSAGARDLASHVLPGVQLRLVNRTNRYLRGVRVEVVFDGQVEALDWNDPDDVNYADPFPGAPMGWGRHTVFATLARSTAIQATVYTPRSQHGIVRVDATVPAALVMQMDDLRPSETYTSDDDDVVLVVLSDEVGAGSVRGRWRITAEDVHEVFSGEVEVPVESHDWRQELRDWYSPDEGEGH